MVAHKKKAVIIGSSVAAILVVVISVLIMTHIICISHNWQSATCIECEKCTYCGKVRGAALGHRWTEATCVNAKSCDICGQTQGEALGHSWIKATCTQATTCKICGEIDGEPLGHRWLPANCTKAKSCKSCGTTEGEPIDHQWLAATCTQPKTCSLCNETEGVPLDHTAGNGEIITSSIINGNYTIKYTCVICNSFMGTDTISYDTFIDTGVFICSPSDFMERVEDAMGEIAGCYLTAGTKTVDGSLFGVVWNTSGKAVAAVTFLGQGDSTITSAYSKSMRGMLVYVEDADSLAYILMGFLRGCDPSLSFSEGKTIGTEVLQACQRNESYDYNGIRYLVTYYSGSYIIGITIVE